MTSFPNADLKALVRPPRFVSAVFLHCSASDNPDHDDASVIDAWHWARGFDGIGYHFFIKKNGTIQQGRKLARTPAAQEGHNTGTIAICLHGLDVQKFTPAQQTALQTLCIALDKLYRHALVFRGHCEVNPNKTCPVFPYKKWLKLDSGGRLCLSV